MKTKLIKFAMAALEEKMLKIYATIMTTVFLAIWIPTMFVVLKDLFTFWFEYLF